MDFSSFAHNIALIPMVHQQRLYNQQSVVQRRVALWRLGGRESLAARALLGVLAKRALTILQQLGSLRVARLGSDPGQDAQRIRVPRKGLDHALGCLDRADNLRSPFLTGNCSEERVI